MIQKWERNLPGSKLDQNSEIAKTNAVWLAGQGAIQRTYPVVGGLGSENLKKDPHVLYFVPLLKKNTSKVQLLL
jgi:hypothetical protein